MTLLGMQLQKIIMNFHVIVSLFWDQLVSYVLPLLEAMQRFSKLTQVINTLVCNFMTSIIVNIINIYVMYVDPLKRYNHPQFQMFNDLVINSCEVFTWCGTWSHIPRGEYIAF